MEMALTVKSRGGSPLTTVLAIILIAAGLIIIFKFKQYLPIGGGLLVAAIMVLILSFIVGSGEETRMLINDEGINDVRLGVGMIPWTQIESVYLESKYNNQYLCLKLKSPQQFLSKLPHDKRARLEKHHSLGMTIFNISIGEMDIDPLDLLTLVRKMCQS
jgi:hypothetical protein